MSAAAGSTAQTSSHQPQPQQQQQQEQQHQESPHASGSAPAAAEAEVPEMADWRQLQQPQRAWAWFRSIGSPRYVVAPMVNQSELAFRLLTRRWGAHLCFTPMIHSAVCVRSPTYRKLMFGAAPRPEDRPLVAQFCANDPEVLLEAARYAEPFADAVDINLGCPQMIAHRGRYGSYLLEETDLIVAMVEILHKNLAIPVTCKVRLLPSFEDSLRLCKRIEAAGASMLTVHGRTRDCKHQHTATPDLVAIRRIKQELGIPVILNGGIETLEDLENLLEFTGCDGAMTSEAILELPRMFTPGGAAADPLEVTQEYLDLVQQLNDPGSQRASMPHMFKLLHRHFRVFREVRNNMGKHMGKKNRRKAQRMGKAEYRRMREAAVAANGVGFVPNLLPAHNTLQELRQAIAEAEAAGRDVAAELAAVPSWYRRWWCRPVPPPEVPRPKLSYMQVLQQRLDLPPDEDDGSLEVFMRKVWLTQQEQLNEQEPPQAQALLDMGGPGGPAAAAADCGSDDDQASPEPQPKKQKLSIEAEAAVVAAAEPPPVAAAAEAKEGTPGSECGDLGNCMVDDADDGGKDGYGEEPASMDDSLKPFETEVLKLPSAGHSALRLAQRILASPHYPKVYVLEPAAGVPDVPQP